MLVSLAVMLAVNVYWKEHIAWPWYALMGATVTLTVALVTGKIFGKRPHG
jgi:CDP-diglyceride synthetase